MGIRVHPCREGRGEDDEGGAEANLGMSHTTPSEPRMVQLIDRTVVREYEKDHHGLIFGWTEVVKTKQLENECVLRIDAPRMPDRIFFNGEEVSLNKKV